MRQPSITVAICSSLPLDMAGLVLIINSLPGLQLVMFDAEPPPHVLVWDARTSDLTDFPTFPPLTSVLLLVTNEEIGDLPRGVAGLFSKSDTPEALGVAIRQVARGEQYISPSLALAILKHKQSGTSAQAVDHHNLTEREREILALLGKGLSNKAIANRLYLSVRTVEGHLAKLYPLLGVHSRMEAILIAARSDLSSPIK